MVQTQKKLPELKKESDTFKLIIPKEVEEKIRHLCRCVPDVEWSGRLFYRTEGSIANKDLIITCVDIYPMDIGSTTYTEFDETPDYFGYMVDKDLMDCNIGLIHSHNWMSTFFSGTDTQTLREEGNDNNHFVSLIVNNAGKYTAAVTRKVTTVMNVVATDSFRTFDDSQVDIEGQRTWQQTVDTIDYYMLDIDKEEIPNTFNELDIRLSEIRKAKAKKEEEKKKKSVDITANKPWYANDRFDDHSFLDKHYYNQPSLFEEEELGPKTIVSESQQVEPDSESKVEEEGYYDFQVTTDMVDTILIQLITGSVLISNTSNIDLKKFIGSMKSLYDKRFPNDPDAYFYYYWMENFIDFLFMEAIPDGLTVEAEKQCEFNLGMALIEELESLTSNIKKGNNPYIDILFELLNHKVDY